MFDFFRKPKSRLITTNPPARAIALAYKESNLRKQKEEQKQRINKHYDYLIKGINQNITMGLLSYSYNMNGDYTGDYHRRKYTRDNKLAYLAARRLRKNGFKVKTIRTSYAHSYMMMVDGTVDRSNPILAWTKSIRIEW